MRALRQRRGWRQLDVAARARASQSLIARIERGGADRLTVRRLGSIAEVLGARVTVRIDWNGEAADRLLDMAHAALVELVVTSLRAAGWEVIPEATFAIGGERGSIDVLAWHAGTATLLVVEVKSVVPDMQSMLAVHDRKLRHADSIARSRGWRPGRIGSLLVLGEGRTSRRRVAVHAATLDARFPERTAAVRRFIRDPAGADRALRGLWFLSPSTGAGSRQRIVMRRPRT